MNNFKIDIKDNSDTPSYIVTDSNNKILESHTTTDIGEFYDMLSEAEKRFNLK